MITRARNTGRWMSVLGVLVVGLVSAGCRGPKPVYQHVPSAARTGDGGSTADTHVFQVGELVKYFCHGATEVREARIDEDGILLLPGIGSVEAAGRTPRQLQKELQKKYPRYFGFPEHERVYYVGGEVRTPGPKAYLGKTTVSTAIQAAGDFTKAANKRKVKLIRSDGQSEVIRNLLEAIHPPNDPPVYPGDKIEVPRKWWH